MVDILMKHRLRWLGHIARMESNQLPKQLLFGESNRLPKQLLFGELVKKSPSHGTKRRWRDVAAADIKAMAISEGEWYDLAQERSIWREMCKDGQALLAESERYRVGVASLSRSNRTGIYPCPCGRSFRRKGDCTKHSRFCEKANTDTSDPSCHFIRGGIFPRIPLSSTDGRLPRLACVCVHACMYVSGMKHLRSNTCTFM